MLLYGVHIWEKRERYEAQRGLLFTRFYTEKEASQGVVSPVLHRKGGLPGWFSPVLCQKGGLLRGFLPVFMPESGFPGVVGSLFLPGMCQK